MNPPPSGAGSPALELLRAVQAGAPEAIDAWFRAEHPPVYRLCFGLLANASEADDVAQEAMLHLLEHLRDWDPSRPYGAWRRSVVLNRCRDRLRRVAARRTAEQEPSLAGRAPSDPHTALERSEVETLLALGLRSLPPREREAFVLRDLEGLDTDEVARLLAISASSVRSLVTLARRRLRELLGTRLAPEGRA